MYSPGTSIATCCEARRPAQERAVLERFGLREKCDVLPLESASIVRPHVGNPFPEEARFILPDVRTFSCDSRMRPAGPQTVHVVSYRHYRHAGRSCLSF